MRTLMLYFLGLTVSACAGHKQPADARLELEVPAHVVADARFALACAAETARGAWEDWSPGSVPFVLVYPDEQWVFRAAAAPAGYDPRPISSELGPAYRAPSWTQYDGARVTFPQQFFASADSFDGALTFTIAAPSVAPFLVADWATVFAHEYFHTFQMTQKGWAADLPWIAPLHRRRLAELHRDEPAIRESVSRELSAYASLLQAIHAGGALDWEALGELAQLRRERSLVLSKIDPNLPRAERALERFEGIARYVEESAYENGAVALHFQGREPGWKQTAWPDRLKRSLGVSEGEYFYATGNALARILDVCHPGWKRMHEGQDLLELSLSARAKK
ncbi:MAG: hypothetical protein HY901_09015 [Deltaproteobacteria bacterium]|nr:hypothetical protein [Deltaproteobacteria bacterium]